MLKLQQRLTVNRSSSTPTFAASVSRYSHVGSVRPLPVLARTNKPSLLTVLSGRGDEVVAFLPDTGSEQRTATATDQTVKVYTMDGRQFTLPLVPGITSVKEIRAYVAEKENAPIAKVRLAYGGRELNPDMDFQTFVPMPGINVMHAMHRMSGGGAAGGPPTPNSF